MKKKVLSITLVAAILVSMFSVGIFSVSAAKKIVGNKVTFNLSGSSTKGLPEGTDAADYIAEKKASFERKVDQLAHGETGEGEVDDYSSLFTDNTYAVIKSTSQGNVTYEYSDDAVFDGDINDWDNLNVTSGRVYMLKGIVVNYELITIDGTAEVDEIDEVELEITAPLAGKSISDTYPNMSNYSGSYYMSGWSWCDENGTPIGEDGEISEDLKFDAGNTYYVRFLLFANEGYIWKQDIENIPLTIHNGTVVGSLSLDSSEETIECYGQPAVVGVLAVEAVEAPDGLITDVEINFIAPSAGDQVTLTDGKLSPVPDVTIPDGANYNFAGNTYSENGEPVWVDSDDFFDLNVVSEPFTFEAENTYYLYLNFVPDEGHHFNCDYTELKIDTECEYSTCSYFSGDDNLQLLIRFTAEEKQVGPVEPETSFFGVLISDAEGNVNTGGGYVLSYEGNPFGDMVRTSASNNFVYDEDYVSVTAVPDNGYYFKGWYQGEPNGETGEPVYSGGVLSTSDTFEFFAPIDMELPYICAVFEEGEAPPTRKADQIQVWITDGGTAAVEYTPSEPNIYDLRTKDGTNYVSIGEVVQLYTGDEITVYQKPDEGYHFKGWYHVRIEWGPGDVLPKYEGEAISTDPIFTYQPGVTVVDGDTEPLRYVCAVFEEDQSSDKLIGDANGDGNVDVLDAATIQKHAAGKADLTDEQKYVADVNNDNSVDVLDAAEIQKYSVGKITSFKKKA